MLRLSFEGVLILGLTLVGGCGGGDSEGALPPNGVGDPVIGASGSPEVDLYLDSLCTFPVRCGEISRKLTCVRGMMGGAGRALMDLGSAIKAGTVIYHEDLGTQCASNAMNAPCTEQAYVDLLSVCDSAFEATVGSGGTCHTDYECTTGGSCYDSCAVWETTNCCAGTCEPLQTTTPRPTVGNIADGASCASDGPRCAYITSYCDTVSATCQPRLSVGAECKSSDACIGYASCVQGRCKKRPEIGESCSQTDPWESPCQASGCDVSDNRCAVTTAMKICF
jgi:hypothetical protein